jgi:DNA-directed RNA polymerase specialized sigma24 family protein
MSACTDALAPGVFDLLHGQDWEAICKELVVFALFWARNYRWRKGKYKDLALGHTVEDVVQDVIVKTIEGRRKWDPKKGPLVPWMKDQVKSEIDHLCHSAAHRQEMSDPASAGRESDVGVEGYAPLQRASPTNKPSRNPETAVLRSEAVEQRKKALLQAASGDSELEELVSAIGHGCSPKPRLLAAELGVPVSDINNRLKRLRRRAMKLVEESGS